MRKKLISALATKFAGVEAKVLGRIADNIMHDKTIESDEDVNSAVEEVTFADILKSYGDSRAAEASKTAVSNYEKKHGLKDGKPTAQNDDDDDDEPDDDDDDDPDNNGNDRNRKDGKQKSSKSNANPTNNNKKVSPEMAEMMKMMKAMGEKLESAASEIAGLKKGKITEDRKARLNEVLKGLKDAQKKAYTRLPLDGYSDEDFENLIDEITEEVDELTKENDADGGSFGAPLGGSGEHGGSGKGKEASEAEISSIVDSFNL